MTPRVHTALLCLVACGVLGPAAVLGQAPIEPGEPLPSVGATLRQEDGTTVSPRSMGGEAATVFLFWSNRCPWVDRYEARVDSLAAAFGDRGVQFVLVNANDVDEYPAESLDRTQTPSSIPYVRDPSARLARALGATRTPHAFVFDQEWTLRYAGAIDDSPSLPTEAEELYLREVVRALVAGTAVSTAPQPPFGCTLKPPE